MLSFHGGNVLYVLGELYVVILLVRAVLSWFPHNPDSPLNPVRRIVFTITEPYLAPFRRLIPPIGMIDISFLVAFIVAEVIVQVVFASLPIGASFAELPAEGVRRSPPRSGHPN